MGSSIVEHIHFERCTFQSKNFDMIIILQNFDVLPLSINAVPMNELDAIQEWLTDCSITYTAGQASMSWKSVMNLVKGDPRFYEETDEHGESKPAGWQFLQADDNHDGNEEEDDGDEDYSAGDEEDVNGDDDEDDDALDWDAMEASAQ